MDLSTAAAVAGITFISVASVYRFASIDKARAHVAAVGARPEALLAILMTLGAAAYLVSTSDWAPPFAHAETVDQDEDVARLRAFASSLAPSKSAPMSRIPTSDTLAHNDLPDVDTMIARLAARLANTPEDGEGWKMLGWSLLRTDRPAEAAQAYAKARRLMPASEDVGADLAEALIARDAGTVGHEAQSLIDDVLRAAPGLPKARYFKALARAQQGERAEALAEMTLLEAQADGDAPWVEQMRARIAQLSGAGASASE